MRARRRLVRLWRSGRLSARRAAREVGPACRRLADRLAYRPREIVVVALLAGGLCAGLAVERWRSRYPGTAERLELEPPRRAGAVVPPSMVRARTRPSLPRCEAPAGRGRSARGPAEPASSASGLDLNRATPRELARLAGISWGLAARIVAARDGLETLRAGTTGESTGRRRLQGSRRWEPDEASPGPLEPEPASAVPDPPPVDGTADTPSE
jgi:hypothetical protein